MIILLFHMCSINSFLPSITFLGICHFVFVSFIFIAHFLWACGSLCEPWKFFQTLFFVHSIVCQITHSFLNGFQPNLCQYFSHVCPTCYTSFSLYKMLECICERLLHCRLIVAITWTPSNELHKISDTQSSYIYISLCSES